MPLSPQALIKGLVSRILPSPNPDGFNSDVAVRQGRYGEAQVVSVVRKAHVLADEGTYFVTNNAQTGLATSNITAFTAASPFILIQNQDSSGGKRVYLDYIALTTTTAGSAASGLVAVQTTVVLDNTLRFSSGGTALTANIVSPNMDLSAVKSVATVYAGTITATTASAAARTVCGLRTLRPTVSGTVADVVGEFKLLNFGGVEGATGSVTIANANVIPQAFPPIVIGPGHSALVYLFNATGATNVVSAYAPEVGWFER